jgi:flagellar hook assembly protein FlgD
MDKWLKEQQDKSAPPDHDDAGAHPQAKVLPGYWDGKDKDGKLVPPGVYIWQITAKLQNGDKTTSGTIAVAY